MAKKKEEELTEDIKNLAKNISDYYDPSKTTTDTEAQTAADYAIVFEDEFNKFCKENKLDKNNKSLNVAKFYAQEREILPKASFLDKIDRAKNYRAQIQASQEGSKSFEELYSIYFKDDFELFKRTFNFENKDPNLAISEFFSFQQRNYERIHTGNIQKVKQFAQILNDEHHVARTYSFFFGKEFKEYKERNNLQNSDPIVAIAKFYDFQQNNRTIPFAENLEKVENYISLYNSRIKPLYVIMDQEKRIPGTLPEEKLQTALQVKCYAKVFEEEYKRFKTTHNFENEEQSLAAFYVEDEVLISQKPEDFERKKNLATLYRNLINCQDNNLTSYLTSPIVTESFSFDAQIAMDYATVFSVEFEEFRKTQKLEREPRTLAVALFFAHESKILTDEQRSNDFLVNLEKVELYRKILATGISSYNIDAIRTSTTIDIDVKTAILYSVYYGQELESHKATLGNKDPNVAIASFFVSQKKQPDYSLKLKKLKFQQDLLANPDSDKAKMLKLYATYFKEDFNKFIEDNHLTGVDRTIALTEFYASERGFPDPVKMRERTSYFESRFARINKNREMTRAIAEEKIGAGSARNLVSKVGDVSYLYLPRTQGSTPSYLRVIQKGGKIYLNMEGLDSRFPKQTKTAQIIGVGSHTTSDGNYLSLDIIDNTGKKRRIALPINATAIPSLSNDLKRLLNNDIIQLNAIKPFERPKVDDFKYHSEFELSVPPIEASGTSDTHSDTHDAGKSEILSEDNGNIDSTIQKHKHGEQGLEEDSFTNLSPTGGSYEGLSQEIVINEHFGLKTPQKMTIILDSKEASEHILSVVSRRNSEGEKEIQAVLFENADGKKIRLSESYVQSFRENGVTIDFGTPTDDGYYQFDVAQVQVTQDGKTQYGIKIAGTELGLFINAVGSEIIADGQRKIVMAQDYPNDIAYSDSIIERFFNPDSGVSFSIPKEETIKDTTIKNLPMYLQQMLIANISLKRNKDKDNSPKVSIRYGEGEPNIQLFSYRMKIQDKKIQEMTFMTRTNSSGRTEIYLYAKVGSAQPKLVKVRSIRLGVEGIATEQKNPRLIMEIGESKKTTTTIITQLDNFSDAKECLKEMYYGPLKQLFTAPEESSERKVSEVSYLNLDTGALSEDKNNSIIVSQNAPITSASDADFARISQMEINPNEDLQPNREELNNHEHNLPPRESVPEQFEPAEQIENPETVDPPEKHKPEEWKPHPPMPELRNGLLGFGVIMLLLSFVVPFLSFLCLPFFASAAIVEIQPWNTLNKNRQEKLKAEIEKIQEREKALENQLEKYNTKINNDKTELRKIEKEIKEKYTDKGLPIPDKIKQKKLDIQKKIYLSQLEAQKITLTAKKKELDQLAERTKVAREREKEEYLKKEENAAKAIQAATQKDIEQNPELESKKAKIEHLESKPFGSLTPSEQAELEELRKKFKFRSEASKTYEDVVHDHKAYESATRQNLRDLETESGNTQLEISKIDGKLNDSTHISADEYSNISADFENIELPNHSQVLGVNTTTSEAIEDASYRKKDPLSGNPIRRNQSEKTNTR